MEEPTTPTRAAAAREWGDLFALAIVAAVAYRGIWFSSAFSNFRFHDGIFIACFYALLALPIWASARHAQARSGKWTWRLVLSVLLGVASFAVAWLVVDLTVAATFSTSDKAYYGAFKFVGVSAAYGLLPLMYAMFCLPLLVWLLTTVRRSLERTTPLATGSIQAAIALLAAWPFAV